MLEAVCSSPVVPPSGRVFPSSVYGCSSGAVLLRAPSFDASCSQVESGLSETRPLVLRSPVNKAWNNVFSYWLYEQIDRIHR